MSTYSAYKTSGKPLSVEAQYHQKLKQGVFQSPSGTIVGVNSNASDTAALLAASSDLTVKPSYERSVAPEAHTAALAAKQHPSSRDHNNKSNTITSTTSSNIPSTTVKVGIPSLDSGSIYKAAHQNSTSTMNSRTNPGKDNRSGLQSKQVAGGTLNIDKINQLANRNSSKSLNSRFNPDLDYRSGLKKQKPTEFLNQEEEDLAASGAAASLKHGGEDFYSTQTRSNTFKAGDIVNSTLLAAANSKANERLNSLKATTPQSLRDQAQLYANALALAQKNSNERLKTHQSGLINLGGGLTITQAELDKLASSYVNPILHDIEGKADSKRKVDLERKQKQLELQQLHEKSKQAEQAAKLKEKQDLEAAKQKRLSDNEKLKKSEDEKFAEYQKERNAEVDQKNEDFKELEAKHKEEKDALLKKKEENQNQIDEEEAEKISERKEELDGLQAEKDEELKPTLDELKNENEKLKKVTDARDELANEVKISEDTNKEYEEKLAELKKKLDETREEVEKYTADLEDATKKHETTDKELFDFQKTHDSQKANYDLETKELDSKWDELSKKKEEHLKEKENKKKKILSYLNARVKDEHKINQELPDHLRSEVDERKLKDTSSIFTVEESELKSKPLIKETGGAEKDKPHSSNTEKSEISKSKINSKPEEKKTDTLKSKAGTATTASGPKRPVTPSAAQSPTKKKSFGKRLSSLFKSSSGQPSQLDSKPKTAQTTKPASAEAKPKVSNVANAKASTDKTKETSTSTKQPAAKDAEKEAKKVKQNDSADYGNYDDDISLNKKQNQGGVFKEEI